MSPRKKKATEYASGRVTTEILQQIRHYAEKERRTVSSMLRILIEEALDYRRHQDELAEEQNQRYKTA